MSSLKPASYEEDFFAWTQESASMLREGRFSEIDAEHIAEEIEDMGKRDKRELNSRLEVLTRHLLKWEQQPDLRGRSWTATISTQREDIKELIEESPSLKAHLTDILLERIFQKAVNKAVIETGLTRDCFPPLNPYSLDQLLNDYWPD